METPREGTARHAQKRTISLWKKYYSWSLGVKAIRECIGRLFIRAPFNSSIIRYSRALSDLYCTCDFFCVIFPGEEEKLVRERRRGKTWGNHLINSYCLIITCRELKAILSALFPIHRFHILFWAVGTRCLLTPAVKTLLILYEHHLVQLGWW